MHLHASGAVAPREASGRPLRWAATGRSGGVSRAPYDTLNLADHVGDERDLVEANRALLAQELGVGGLAVMQAVHGAGVAVVSEPGSVPAVDALVTQVEGLGLLALAADCVPLALIGRDRRTVAVAHCGWHGLVVDVVGAVVSTMAALGTTVESAVLGPSICGRCYAVPGERAAEVARSVAGTAALTVCADGQPGIDVAAGVVTRLTELGVPDITVDPACTAETSTLFSYRRDGRTGRQGMAVAMMAP